MEKKLPNVFVTPTAKKIKNSNREIFYSISHNETAIAQTNEKILKDKLSELAIRKKVNDLFSLNSFVYKAKVLLTTKDNGTSKEIIISKDSDGILTLNNKKIKYEDIINIKNI